MTSDQILLNFSNTLNELMKQHPEVQFIVVANHINDGDGTTLLVAGNCCIMCAFNSLKNFIKTEKITHDLDEVKHDSSRIN